jgi:ribokinase
VPEAAGGGRAGPVLVVGDLVTDVTARLHEPPAPGSDAAATVRLGGGGAAANVACWLAAAGVDVVLVARVGDDAAGHERAAELERAGVQARLTVDPSAATGTIVVLVEPGGERTMLTDRGANLRLAAADVTPGLVEAAAWVHLSGYALLDDGPRPAALATLARARAAGVGVSVDPASVEPLRRVGAGRFLEWVTGAALLLPNAAEAALLAGHGRAGGPRTDDPERAAAALARASAEVAVTLGPGGVVWHDGTRAVHRPAPPGDVVDTTGAGDAFCAGFLAARLGGASPEASCEAGVALAGRAVRTVGARPAG